MSIPNLSSVGLYAIADFNGWDNNHYYAYVTNAGFVSPNPLPTIPGFVLWDNSQTSTNQQLVIYRQVVTPTPVPTPTPTPIPTPTPTPVQRTQTIPSDPNAASRGVGVFYRQNQHSPVILNTLVNGWEQNIVVTAESAGINLTIDNVVSINANSNGAFEGQGLYVEQLTGNFNVSNSLFGWNGRPLTQPGYTPTMFRHGCYCQATASPANFDQCIFAGNANAGVQLRSGGKITNSIFLDNGNSLIGVMGKIELDNCIIYDGHFVFDGSAWTSNTAILSYYPVTLNNVIIVGRTTQLTVPTNKPGARSFPQGALNLGGTWSNNGDPVWVPPPSNVPMLNANNCEIHGWPGATMNGQKLTTLPGFTKITPNAINYDYMSVLNQVVNNTLSVADAIAEIRQAITSQLT